MTRITAYAAADYTFDDYPEEVPAGVIAVIHGADSPPSCVRFACPCGCGKMLMIPVMKVVGRPGSPRVPRWTMTRAGSSVTLSPSILLTADCRSHFFIRDGRVQWAG